MSILIYGVYSLIIIGLGGVYYLGSTGNLLFILKPVTQLVHNFLGADFTYYDGIGYVSSTYRINIARDCAGIYFLIMVLSMLVFTVLPTIKTKRIKGLTFLGVLGVSYGVTLIANASRIVSIIFVMDTGLITTPRQEGVMHQSVGVVVYLFYLVLTYGLFTKLVKNWRGKNETTV